MWLHDQGLLIRAMNARDMSGPQLAARIGKSRQYVHGLLTDPSRRTAADATALSISEVVGVQIDVLWLPGRPRVVQRICAPRG